MVIIEELDDMATPNRSLVVSENFRGRVLDSQGISAIRAGQTVDAGLFDAVKASYSNLVYHPIALFFFCMGTFIFIAETYETVGPLELIAQQFHKTADNSTNNLVRAFMALLLFPLEKLIANKIVVAIICLMLVPYSCKPSRSNLFFTAVFLFTFLIAEFTVLEVFVCSNLFFLFVMIRSPIYRLIIIFVFIVIAFGVFEVEKMLQELRSAHAKLNVKVPKSSSTFDTTTAAPVGRIITTTTKKN
ncbi:hypothetical protein [Nephila clavipes virus 4]|uniref:hypothetical protein n=1 Tax=Nephila clavipes virus 4 TaxID=2108201 RepID=UPI000D20858F|nr:hypothetical protein [Nephila clavipes virus 4]AVK59482.1 hypothetical protein [Nephila clavipes virus 4]